MEVVFLVSIGLTHYKAMAERGMYKKCSSLLQRNFCNIKQLGGDLCKSGPRRFTSEKSFAR